jgi:predicted type IV restriction endonuclease
MSFMDPVLLARDHSLEILKMPQDHTDEEICIALNALTGGKIEKSPVYIKDAERGAHLFAAVWRYMTIHCREDERDLFTACFGKRKSYQWRPLANAVYYDRTERKDTVYVINACRRYVYSNDAWKEERYDELFFDKYRVHAVVHETDRQLRR